MPPPCCCMSEVVPSALLSARQVADLEARLQSEKAAAGAAEGERSRLVAGFAEELLTEQAAAAARQETVVAAVEERHRAETADLQRTHDAALSAAAAEVTAAEAASEAVLGAALASLQVPRRVLTQVPDSQQRRRAEGGRLLMPFPSQVSSKHMRDSHVHHRLARQTCRPMHTCRVTGRHRTAAGDACRRAGVGPCRRPRCGGGPSAAGRAAGGRSGGLRCRGGAQPMRSGRGAEWGPGGARRGGGSP